MNWKMQSWMGWKDPGLEGAGKKWRGGEEGDFDPFEAKENEEPFDAQEPVDPIPTPPSKPKATAPMFCDESGGPLEKPVGASAIEGGLAGESVKAYFSEGGRSSPNEYDFPDMPPAPPKKRPCPWPEDVVTLMDVMDRKRAVLEGEGGFRISVDRRLSGSRGWRDVRPADLLAGPRGWSAVSRYDSGEPYLLNWRRGDERGAMRTAWRLGRVRKIQPGDEAGWSDPFEWYFWDTWERYFGYGAEMEKGPEGRILLRLRDPEDEEDVRVLLIDEGRRSVEEVRTIRGGKTVHTIRFDGFTQAGGIWWPTRIRTRGEGEDFHEVARIRVEGMAASEFERALEKEWAVLEEAVLLGELPCRIEKAFLEADEGGATLETHWALVRHHGKHERWDLAAPHMRAVEKLIEGKWGRCIIRLNHLSAKRRGEDWKKELFGAARILAEKPRPGDFPCARRLHDMAWRLSGGTERYRFLEILKPVYERQGDDVAMRGWERGLVEALKRMGRKREALDRERILAEKWPEEHHLQSQYAQSLAHRGEVDEAVDHLRKAVERLGKNGSRDADDLHRAALYHLWNHNRFESFLEYMDAHAGEIRGYGQRCCFSQYLSALLHLGRVDDAKKTLRQWLLPRDLSNLEPIDRNRMDGAFDHMGGYLHRSRHDRRRMLRPDGPLLVDLVNAYSKVDTLWGYVGRILNRDDFRRTEEGRRMRLALLKELREGRETLPPRRVAALAGWLLASDDDPDLGEPERSEILRSILFRARKEDSREDGWPLLAFLFDREKGERRLEARRIALARAEGEEEVAAASRRLFEDILEGKWFEGAHEELFSLMASMTTAVSQEGEGEDFIVSPARLVVDLYYLAAWLSSARATAYVASLPDVGKMDRRTLFEVKRKAYVKACGETARLLEKLEKDFSLDELRPWIAMERITLDVIGGGDKEALFRETMELLRASVDVLARKQDEKVVIRGWTLAVRALTTAMHLATRDPSSKEKAEEMGRFIEEARNRDSFIDWKAAEYMLLLARNRTADLKAALESWYGDGKKHSQWRWGR
ncbi:MAG: tetratricopeptide repeat protein, partial [Planctomycetota bacterium]